MQTHYTGLKDKNGVEIYEGDIVERLLYEEVNVIGVVIFVKEGWTGFLLKVKEETGYRYYTIGNNENGKNEDDMVLGNIYENPELLEGRE